MLVRCVESGSKGERRDDPSRIGRIMSLIGLPDLCGLIECTGGQGPAKINALCLVEA